MDGMNSPPNLLSRKTAITNKITTVVMMIFGIFKALVSTDLYLFSILTIMRSEKFCFSLIFLLRKMLLTIGI
ncbi:hypothetical protein D3C85_1450440 [compost metagenome]